MTLLRPYKRLLIKLSGELLQGPQGFGLHQETIKNLCMQLSALRPDHEVAIVIGGGNFLRGAHAAGFLRADADEIGMLATVMNGKALRSVLTQLGVSSRLFGTRGADPYDSYHARQALQQGDIVICAGGTGNAFVTTDTAAVTRACELQADVLLKATDVDGIYSKDPQTNPDAIFFPKITYEEALQKNLAVMDRTAFTLAFENALPIIVFSMKEGIPALISGATRHTYVGA